MGAFDGGRPFQRRCTPQHCGLVSGHYFSRAETGRVQAGLQSLMFSHRWQGLKAPSFWYGLRHG